MKDRLEGATRKGGPIGGLFTILVASALFLAFLVGVTAFIRLAMS